MKRMIIASLILASCSTIEIVDLPEVEPKIVMKFIAYDSVAWTGSLTISQPILNNNHEQEPITDAEVTIYENNSLLSSLQYFGNGSPFDVGDYKADDSYPKPGMTYRIVVNSPRLGMAAASYTQPDSIVITNLHASLTPIGDGSSRIDIELSFNDPPGPDYYELHGRVQFSPGASQEVRPRFIDPSYRELKEIYMPVIFTDELFDGTTTTLRFTSEVIESEAESFRIYLRHLSPECYHFLRGIHLQKIAEGDPFAQPVSVKGNVENGYGVFGGVTESTAVFRLK